MTNLRLALRMLFRTPALTAIAILSLAIGIGANAAILSLYNQMLMRPLPVADPYALVNLGAPGPKHGSQSSNNAGSQDTPSATPCSATSKRRRRASAASPPIGSSRRACRSRARPRRARACSSPAATSACSA